MSIGEQTFVRATSARKVETEVSGYDVLNGWLLATLILLGFLVMSMFLVWLNSGNKLNKPPILTDLSRSMVEETGDGEDDEDPGIDDFPDVESPALANALEAIPDAISSVLGRTGDVSGDALVQGRGNGRGRRGAKGVPEHKRWIIQYESENINTYAQQLSFFDIDIGVFYMSSPSIIRLHDPGRSNQAIQTNREEEKKTLLFMHKEARMKRWDDELARRAGISLDPDGATCQLYPERTRQIIRQVEAEALQQAGRDLSMVRNTILKVEPEGNGFRFNVVNFLYK